VFKICFQNQFAPLHSGATPVAAPGGGGSAANRLRLVATPGDGFTLMPEAGLGVVNKHSTDV